MQMEMLVCGFLQVTQTKDELQWSLLPMNMLFWLG